MARYQQRRSGGATRPRQGSPVAAAVKAAARKQAVAGFPTAPVTGATLAPVVMVGWHPNGEKPLSVNRTSGRAYQTTYTHKHAWEDFGANLAREHADLLEPFRGRRIRITVALPVTRPGACDAANFAGGVSVKALQDGITRTGLLVPDDNSRWLETTVVFWSGGATKDEVRIKVECAPVQADPAAW